MEDTSDVVPESAFGASVPGIVYTASRYINHLQILFWIADR